jgi:hypothetical protein
LDLDRGRSEEDHDPRPSRPQHQQLNLLDLEQPRAEV